MTDREKVIKGLETCSDVYYGADGACSSCPYSQANGDRCLAELVYDAITLLKEQEAVEPKVTSTEQRCGNCHKVIEMDGWIACPWCGKSIAWNEWWNKNGGRAVK